MWCKQISEVKYGDGSVEIQAGSRGDMEDTKAVLVTFADRRPWSQSLQLSRRESGVVCDVGCTSGRSAFWRTVSLFSVRRLKSGFGEYSFGGLFIYQ